LITYQDTIEISPVSRGYHNITRQIQDRLTQFPRVEQGLLHLFLMHTSAALTINENADPDVLKDLDLAINKIVPENWPYRHTDEGPDDMPAHVKSSLIGVSLCIPVTSQQLRLGTWQGVYLCEFRNHGGPRKVVLTLDGVAS